MITEIGFAAGDIWNYLDKHGESTLKEILQGIRKPRDLALMSLGWLAREGHVTIDQAGRTYRIRLTGKG